MLEWRCPETIHWSPSFAEAEPALLSMLYFCSISMPVQPLLSFCTWSPLNLAALLSSTSGVYGSSLVGSHNRTRSQDLVSVPPFQPRGGLQSDPRQGMEGRSVESLLDKAKRLADEARVQRVSC